MTLRRELPGGLTRAALAEIVPYEPGKPIEEVQRELGLERVVKLASNEGPLGPFPGALEAIERAADRATEPSVAVAAGRAADGPGSGSAASPEAETETAAAAGSRRSKSIPHQAQIDQSSPTSLVQFGQTRFRRVRQVGQTIHSSLIRRRQPGQFFTVSISDSMASWASVRSYTSSLFSCGRTIR